MTMIGMDVSTKLCGASPSIIYYRDNMTKLLKALGIIVALLLFIPGVSAETYTVHSTELSEPLLILFIVIDFVLLFFAMSDYENRFYGNIIAGVMSIILSLTLGATLIGGTRNTVMMVLNNTTVVMTNNSTSVEYIYDTYNTIGHSAGLGLFMVATALVMIVFVIMNILQMFSDMEDEFEF